MDFIASSAKAALSGSIWPSHAHGVQRAGNSRVTHHVGHSRNINSHVPSLLRLGVGEVSSDGHKAIQSTNNYKMTPKISVAEASPGNTKIMDTFAALIPFGASLFNFGQVSSKLGLADNRTTRFGNQALGEMFGGQLTREKQVPINRVQGPSMKTKAFPIEDTSMKKFPFCMDAPFRQNLVVNSFNQSLLENNCTGDMDSPWNKFYSQWKQKEGKSFPCVSDCTKPTTNNLSDAGKKGLKRVLEDAIQHQADASCELNSRLQSLSLHSSVKAEKFEHSKPENIKKPDMESESNVAGISIDSSTSAVSGEKQNLDKISVSKTSKMVANANLSLRIGDQPHTACTSRNTDIDLHLNGCIPYSFPCDTVNKYVHNSNVQTGQNSAKPMIEGCSNMTACNSVLSRERCPKQKRSRPSSKKRRRQKARQHSSYNNNKLVSQENAENVQHPQVKKKCRFEKSDLTDWEETNCTNPDISVSPSVCKDEHTKSETTFPMSFIVGVNEFGTGECGSYQVSVLMDNEESAFSEEEDCDNFDISYRCDFLPLSGDLFNPLNFTMSISVSPSTPDFCPKSPFQNMSSELDVINASWRVYCDNSELKSKSSKKVSFASEDNLVSVHPMIAWSYAYQSARRGPWEEYARDRQRFQRRIDEAECLLSSILKPNHRAAVYQRIQGPVKDA